jgi:hypothetical protein
LLRYAPRCHRKFWLKIFWLKKFKKKFQKSFCEFFFQFFLAIMVPRPIWRVAFISRRYFPMSPQSEKYDFAISPRYFPISPRLWYFYQFSHISALFSHISAFLKFYIFSHISALLFIFPISPRYACENYFWGGLGPLVWKEIETAQTVHKCLAKLLYRFLTFRQTLEISFIFWYNIISYHLPKKWYNIVYIISLK